MFDEKLIFQVFAAWAAIIGVALIGIGVLIGKLV